MRTAALLTCGALALVAAVSSTASTASTTIPAVTAGSHTLDVIGATAKSNTFSLSADRTTITSARVDLLGNHALSVVTARFGSNPDTVCVVGLYDSTQTTTPVTCTGFLQPVNTSVRFTVTVT